MKFSTAFTSLILIIPLIAGEAFAAAAGNGGKGRGGFKGKGGNQGNGAATNGTAVNNGTVVNTGTAVNNGTAVNTGAAVNNGTAVNTGAAVNNGTAVNNAAGNNAGNNNNDPQTSLTLDPKVIATGFEQDGQATPTAGQVASLTSNNNFINFCLTVGNLPITNGQQIKTGSCNPAPMGVIAATSNMPSSKFVVPVNGQDFAPNTAFTIQMRINNLETGNFVNAASNYYSAPQQVNAGGTIIGHTHFTVQSIPSFTSTQPLDPNVFAFFKGVNGAAQGGIVSESVANGLPAGNYRLCSMNTDANHTPALVAVAQHGFLDDCVYFTTGANGAANPFNGGNAAANGTGAGAGATPPPPPAANGTAATPPPAANGTAATPPPATNGTAAAPVASSAAAGNGGKNTKGKGKNGRGRRSVVRQARLGRDY